MLERIVKRAVPGLGESPATVRKADTGHWRVRFDSGPSMHGTVLKQGCPSAGRVPEID
jgi:hypothetical protein